MVILGLRLVVIIGEDIGFGVEYLENLLAVTIVNFYKASFGTGSSLVGFFCSIV